MGTQKKTIKSRVNTSYVNREIYIRIIIYIKKWKGSNDKTVVPVNTNLFLENKSHTLTLSFIINSLGSNS